MIAIIDWLELHGSMLVLMGFFALFLAFAFWAYRPANKRKFQDYGRIPLEEGRHGE